MFAKRLPLDYAFHSPAMDSIQEGVVEALADIQPQPTRIPYVSTVTGAVAAGDTLDAHYWWLNIREPVRFDDAATHLIQQGYNVFVEVGAHPILRRYLNESLRQQAQSGLVLGTLERHKPGLDGLQRTLSQLLLSGLTLPSGHYFPVEGQRVLLPRYPWQRTQLWVQGTRDGQGLLSRYYQHPLLGYPLAQQEHTGKASWTPSASPGWPITWWAKAPSSPAQVSSSWPWPRPCSKRIPRCWISKSWKSARRCYWMAPTGAPCA